VYNRVLNQQLLDWLAKAAKVPRQSLVKARLAVKRGTTHHKECAGFRKQVPWEMVE
jgi:hypothetical protein